MNLIRRYLTPSAEVGEDAGTDVVETLVDRFQTATRVEDRRDAMRGIKALSKRYRLEVGTQAMVSCIDALSRDSDDPDTVAYALDALCNMMNDESHELEPRDVVNIPPDLGKQFTEIFIKEPENVQFVLSSLSSYDMHLRRKTIMLLVIMLQNNRKPVQDLLLNSPIAVSKFMATLCDPMEAIRNDGLLLLLYFTQCHATIQKIVAFENVFESLLSIVESETLGDGGVVVEDCFQLLHQLLAGNKQNQVLFKDGRFIQRLSKLFDEIPAELEESCTFSAQKRANIDWLLEILRCLVSPSNKIQNVRGFQSDMESCGLLTSLWKVVMAGGVPADLLTKTLYTLGEAVRGCQDNQQTLVSMVAPSEPPQPAVTVLLVTMVNERQQLAVRLAVLYCFQCLLASNPEIQNQVVSTLLPRDSEPCMTSAGQLLCGGLFSQDSLTTWLSAVALLHSINNNHHLKESLLQVHMAPTTGGGSPVTLMQQCFRLVCQTGDSQGKVGLLQLLCVWMARCPPAVHAFLSLRLGNSHDAPGGGGNSSSGNQSANAVGAAISHLLAEVSSCDGVEEIDVVNILSALAIGICVCYNEGAVDGYDRNSLIRTIDRRIGLDDLVKRIGQVFGLDAFIRALKDPEPRAATRNDLVFDYEFTHVLKAVEFEVSTKLMRSGDVVDEAEGESQSENDRRRRADENVEVRNSQHEMLVAYQQAVAERDSALQSFQLRIIELERQLASAQQSSAQNGCSLKQTNDAGNAELKASLSQTTAKLHAAEQRIGELEMALSAGTTEKETLKSEHEDLLLLLNDQDTQISDLTSKLEKMGYQAVEAPAGVVNPPPQEQDPHASAANASQFSHSGPPVPQVTFQTQQPQVLPVYVNHPSHGPGSQSPPYLQSHLPPHTQAYPQAAAAAVVTPTQDYSSQARTTYYPVGVTNTSP